jgi:enoyl-CoA hydratase/carnithine racemase
LNSAAPLLDREMPAPGVVRLWLNRGQQRNALSIGLMQALLDGLAHEAETHETRVIVIAGRGPAFCAGHDLKELTAARSSQDMGAAFFAETFGLCATLMQSIMRHPKPLIAQVHGIATAAGCQLVASCDLAVASGQASFATPGVDIGLFCSTPMVALSRNLSRKHAMEMLLTGESVSAVRAAALGLVNRVAEHDALDAETLALAALIASKPARTLRTGKEAFYAQAEMDLSSAYAFASEVMTRNMLDGEACEGIGAFVEKRKPVWPG